MPLSFLLSFLTPVSSRHVAQLRSTCLRRLVLINNPLHCIEEPATYTHCVQLRKSLQNSFHLIRSSGPTRFCRAFVCQGKQHRGLIAQFFVLPMRHCCRWRQSKSAGNEVPAFFVMFGCHPVRHPLRLLA